MAAVYPEEGRSFGWAVLVRDGSLNVDVRLCRTSLHKPSARPEERTWTLECPGTGTSKGLWSSKVKKHTSRNSHQILSNVIYEKDLCFKFVGCFSL